MFKLILTILLILIILFLIEAIKEAGKVFGKKLLEWLAEKIKKHFSSKPPK